MKQFYETYRESAFLSLVAREMYSEIINNFKDNYIFESNEALNEFLSFGYLGPSYWIGFMCNYKSWCLWWQKNKGKSRDLMIIKKSQYVLHIVPVRKTKKIRTEEEWYAWDTEAQISGAFY